ncbi:hypothetical protein HK101_001348, partial [Irineochytrium annulatum]
MRTEGSSSNRIVQVASHDSEDGATGTTSGTSKDWIPRFGSDLAKLPAETITAASCEADKIRDALALQFLIGRLTDYLVPLVEANATTYALWTALGSQYAPKSVQSALVLNQELVNLKFDGVNLAAHFARHKNL